MPEQEVLNQEEIDALINGVDSGAVSTQAPPAPGEVRAYDFNRDARIVRGRMPTLVMINERFVKLLRTSFYGLLRRAVVLTAGAIEAMKFGEYVQTLSQPSSINFVKLNPLRGTGLVVFDPKLVFGLVDAFFGGKGRLARIEGRDFTATESRIVALLLRHVFADLKQSWASVLPIEIESVGSEMNPQFVNVVSPAEVVVVTRFTAELDGGGGDLHVVLPYSMIEPLRDIFDAGVQGDRLDRDERWTEALREELEDAEVTLNCVLGRATLSLAELVNLRPGDVVPCSFSGKATMYAEDVPIFRGTYGASRGQHAVKVDERASRSRLAMGSIPLARPA